MGYRLLNFMKVKFEECGGHVTTMTHLVLGNPDKTSILTLGLATDF